MGLPSKCNSTLSTEDADCAINVPHKGVCPIGYHIPSNVEWEQLFRYVDGSSGTSSPYASPDAGQYLKAASSWNDCSSSGSSYLCLDTYKFSALPGGYRGIIGLSNSYFEEVGIYGYWWTASEIGSTYAYRRAMWYRQEYAGWSGQVKSNGFSVRCVND
jgi:uncharacterized protein (TIGR02145 family)